MLTLSNICKAYNKHKILIDFSFEFNTNSIYLLKGANGVGKTTLLKIIKGILLPDAGVISAKYEASPSSVCTYVDSNNRSFFHRLSVKTNLEYFQALNGLRVDYNIISSLLSEFGMQHFLSKQFSTLSLGQMQIVGIIRGMLAQPRIFLLDEATANIDKDKIQILAAYLNNYSESGDNIIIVCSHNENLNINFRDKITL